MGTTQESIIKNIDEMTETEVKSLLAKMMIRYSQVGAGGYTENNFIEDYRGFYRDIVFKNIKL